MNSTLDGNQSSHPFCLLAFGYLETVNFCLLEVLIIVFLTVLIISGNIIVIFVFHCAPLLNHHTTSYFIQTMAYADLLVGISCLIPSLSLLHYPLPVEESLACQVFGFVVSVLKSVSMASLACISIDRYIAITKPLTYNTLVTPWRLRLCIFLIWLYSTLVFLPSFFHWGKPGYHGDVFQWCAESWYTSPYFTLFIVMMLYAPAALIVCFTYFNIFRICQQHTKEISERQARFSSQSGETGEVQACPDKRYAMVLFRITSVFYILWLPYIISLLMRCAEICLERMWCLCQCERSIPFPLLSLRCYLTWNVVVLTASGFCSQTGLGIMLGIFILPDSEPWRTPRDLCNQDSSCQRPSRFVTLLGLWQEEVTFSGASADTCLT